MSNNRVSNNHLINLIKKKAPSALIESEWLFLSDRKKMALWMDDDCSKIIAAVDDGITKERIIGRKALYEQDKEFHKRKVIEIASSQEFKEACGLIKFDFFKWIQVQNYHARYKRVLLRIHDKSGWETISEVVWREVAYLFKYLK